MPNNKMLIDSSHPEETRVAMVRGNRVDEFDFESEHKTQLRGNIYLAKVTRVEPSLQAAFVDYGGNRHGFLAFSEIHPDYYQIPMADRQALLDAEAEDARRDAEAQASEDDDAAEDEDNNGDSGESVEAEAQADSDEAEEKAPRKRRTRRRSKKSDEKAEASADEEASDQPGDSNDEESDASDAAESEEDDDSPEKMNADNDSDDVVSEPAAEAEAEAEEKPKKRRTSRKKATKETDEAKEPEADAEEAPKKTRRTSRPKKVKAEEVSEETKTDEQEEEKPKKRRTSRRKKKDDVAEDAEETKEDTAASTGETQENEEKPKKRRATRRKKAESDADSDAEAETRDPQAEDAAEETSEATESGDEESKPKRTRSRRRSRGRGRKKDDTGDTDDETDENGSVEAVGAEDALEEVPTRRTSRRHYKIQEVIKRRQILLVQVVKEERGNKGAALTTYLSLAGRYSVLMPNTARGGGISRKITNAADRKRLKAIASGLDVPSGMGVILRTAGASRDKAEIQRDFEYLLRLWENVRTLTLESTAPCLTYEEGSLIKRSIRDLYDKDTGEILVAGEDGYREAKDFMAMLMPEHAKNVKLYKNRIPMFAKLGVEAQLDAMLQPQVTLKSGGYLVINQTEALVAIDVNSGRSTRQHSIEETATQTNLEAADEVARQLRLRDLAGLIVIDFIDMEERRNNRAVEKRLKDALKHDRARIQVGRISHFGLLEMSRQRIRASVLESTTQVCPTCDGVGHVRAASSVVLGVLRAIEEQLNKNARNNLTIKVRSQTALYLLNNKRENLSDLETRFRVALNIEIDDTIGLEPCVIERGELANKAPREEEAVQPDTIAPDEHTEDNTEAGQSSQQTSGEDDGGDEKRPKRRRRRRRRKSGDDNAEAEQSGDDDSSEATSSEGEATSEPAAEEPEEKPKRRTRKKKSEEKEAEAEGDQPDAEAKPEEKPKRRTRRTASSKVEAAGASVEAVTEAAEGSDDSSDGEEAAVKPKRRTTRRKKSDEPAAEAEAPEVEAAAESEAGSGDTPKKEGWWRRKFF